MSHYESLSPRNSSLEGCFDLGPPPLSVENVSHFDEFKNLEKLHLQRQLHPNHDRILSVETLKHLRMPSKKISGVATLGQGLESNELRLRSPPVVV